MIRPLNTSGASFKAVLLCAVLVITGFLFFEFPFVHPHREYTFELYAYGNGTVALIFVAALKLGSNKRFHLVNLLALISLIVAMGFLLLQLFLDKHHLDTHIGGAIVLTAALACGILSALFALMGLFVRKSLHNILLSMGVILLLTANLVLPEFTKPYGYKGHLCRAYLNYMLTAFQFYREDTGRLPDSAKWCDIVVQELDLSRKQMCCPFVKSDLCTYAINENIPADANELPADMVVLFESAPGWNQAGGPEDVVTDRHSKDDSGANIAFADGRVEFVKAQDIPKLKWTLEPREKQ